MFPTGDEHGWMIDRELRDQRVIDLIADAMGRAQLTSMRVFACELTGDEGTPIVRFHYYYGREQLQKDVPL